MKCFNVYSEVNRTIEHEDCDEIIQVKGRYCLLEPVTHEWYGDLNRGLARYLHKNLDKYVKAIQYYYHKDGYICFDVILNYDENTAVLYRDREITLYQAVCEYISGQISDGWGENGIILHNWLDGSTINCDCSYELYEEDHKASKQLAKDNNDKFGRFEDYPVYKEIKFSDK